MGWVIINSTVFKTLVSGRILRVVLGMKIKKNGRHVIKTSLSSAVLLSLLLWGQVFAADPLVINNDTGTANTVSEADNSTVIGDVNTVTNSKSQTVVGNNNKVTNRTHKDRDENITDLTIGNLFLSCYAERILSSLRRRVASHHE